MEHQKPSSTKPKNKILKFLPRATSSVSFQNRQLYSPVKDKKPSEKPHKSNLGLGFSGPMISIVPSSETRRKIKNVNDPTFTLVYEPTSPRVSCMGQVKCKHYRKLASNKFSKATSFNNTAVKSTCNNEEDEETVTKGKKKTGFKGLFRGGSRKQVETKSNTAALTLPRAPSLGKMKRFSSGRDAFSNFDWTTQVTPYTDDERDGGSDGEEVRIPASAPVMERNKGVGDNFVRVGGVNLEPRKEINLWKRRTMAQPKPLQLDVAN